MRYKRGINFGRRRACVSRPLRLPTLDVAFLDHLLATVPIGFAFIDPSLKFLRVSATLSDIDGLPVAEHSGRSVMEVVGTQNWPLVERLCRAALSGHAVCDADICGTFPYAPHEAHHVLASFYPVRDKGRITAIAVKVKDITERYRFSDGRKSETIQPDPDEQRRTFLTEMLSTMTEGKLTLCQSDGDLPESLTAVAPPLPLSSGVLSLFRHQVMDAAAWLNFDEERTNDFVLAVGEALDNVLVHAGGGFAQVLVDQTRGTVQVRVKDNGRGINECQLHRAALERGYTTAGTLGHGFCLILNTCDRIWLKTCATGTTIVLEQDRVAPLPAWLFAA